MFSTFSVHYPSITEYKFGRPATDAYHLYETPVIIIRTANTLFGKLNKMWTADIQLLQLLPTKKREIFLYKIPHRVITYSRCHENGSFNVNSFNQHNLSIRPYTGIQCFFYRTSFSYLLTYTIYYCHSVV